MNSVSLTKQLVSSETANSNKGNAHLTTRGKQVLLAPAIIGLDNGVAECCRARALRDSASQANFITVACAKKLGLTERLSSNVQNNSFGDKSIKIIGLTTHG